MTHILIAAHRKKVAHISEANRWWQPICGSTSYGMNDASVRPDAPLCRTCRRIAQQRIDRLTGFLSSVDAKP